MFVIVSEKEIPELEWLSPLTLSPSHARVILLRINPRIVLSTGGKAISTLLHPIPLKSFQKIRGLWVAIGGCMVYAAGSPIADGEIRVIVRELFRREARGLNV